MADEILTIEIQSEPTIEIDLDENRIDPYLQLEDIEVIETPRTTDTEMSDTSENPVQNKTIKSYVDARLDKNYVHTQLRGLNDDSNNVHVTSTERTNLTAITALSTTGFIKRTGSGTYTIDSSTYSLSTHNHNDTYQPADADLTAIAALSGTSGFLKKTATNTWSLDTNSYSLTSHNHSGVYQASDSDLTAIAGLTGTTGLLRKTAANTWTLDTTDYGNSVQIVRW